MTLDVAGRHYGTAEDARRMRRLELFPLINRSRDLMKRGRLGEAGLRQLIANEREYADLMRISGQAGFR